VAWSPSATIVRVGRRVAHAPSGQDRPPGRPGFACRQVRACAAGWSRLLSGEGRLADLWGGWDGWLPGGVDAGRVGAGPLAGERASLGRGAGNDLARRADRRLWLLTPIRATAASPGGHGFGSRGSPLRFPDEVEALAMSKARNRPGSCLRSASSAANG
jgi:hypothetical protein